MNDNEIIKALECCEDKQCNDCPYKFVTDCKERILNCVFSIFNRQQAEKEALIAGQETMSKYIEEQQAEIETQSQNFKMLVSDHRCLQQSFDNLKGLYQAEKEKVESAKSKSIYFAKELQKARAEIERLQELLNGWKTEAYKVADEKDKLYCEAFERVKTIKAEVPKEFAKKIRQKIVVMVCSPDLLTLDDYDKCIDDVLKEMEDDSSE